jgi:hypothetical protein
MRHRPEWRSGGIPNPRPAAIHAELHGASPTSLQTVTSIFWNDARAYSVRLVFAQSGA